jgi:hypothetical protein
MSKNILVILFCIIIGITLFYCYNNSKELFTNRNRISTIYGVHSSRFQNALENERDQMEKDKKRRKENESEAVIEIGHDENENKLFKYKNKIYKLNDNNLLENAEPKKINYKLVPSKLPVIITADKIKSKIPLNFKEHKFKGMISNEYYKQFFVLYEKEYENLNFTDKLYTYILAKNIDDELTVIHKIPPRHRIMVGDTIYFSYGNFQLGPLKFV